MDRPTMNPSPVLCWI